MHARSTVASQVISHAAYPYMHTCAAITNELLTFFEAIFTNILVHLAIHSGAVMGNCQRTAYISNDFILRCATAPPLCLLSALFQARLQMCRYVSCQSSYTCREDTLHTHTHTLFPSTTTTTTLYVFVFIIISSLFALSWHKHSPIGGSLVVFVIP